MTVLDGGLSDNKDAHSREGDMLGTGGQRKVGWGTGKV